MLVGGLQTQACLNSHVSQTSLVQFGAQICPLFHPVLPVDLVEQSIRTESYAESSTADSRADLVYRLECESTSILDRPAVVIRPLVDIAVMKLIEEVSCTQLRSTLRLTHCPHESLHHRTQPQ